MSYLKIRRIWKYEYAFVEFDWPKGKYVHVCSKSRPKMHKIWQSSTLIRIRRVPKQMQAKLRELNILGTEISYHKLTQLPERKEVQRKNNDQLITVWVWGA